MILVTGGAGFIGGNFVLDWLSSKDAEGIVNLDKLTYAGNLATLEPFKNDRRHIFIHGDIIATLQKRQGLMVACPEAIAYRQGWITAEAVQKVATQLSKNSYGQYLGKLLNELNTSSQLVSLSAKKML